MTPEQAEALALRRCVAPEQQMASATELGAARSCRPTLVGERHSDWDEPVSLLSRVFGVQSRRPHAVRVERDLVIPAGDGVPLLANRFWPADIDQPRWCCSAARTARAWRWTGCRTCWQNAATRCCMQLARNQRLRRRVRRIHHSPS